jgi:hypothetical protein
MQRSGFLIPLLSAILSGLTSLIFRRRDNKKHKNNNIGHNVSRIQEYLKHIHGQISKQHSQEAFKGCRDKMLQTTTKTSHAYKCFNFIKREDPIVRSVDVEQRYTLLINLQLNPY